MKNDLRSEFLKTITQFVTAAFAFVAALAWNNAIQGLISRFISPGSGLRSMIYYAIIVTVLAVIITYLLGKMTQDAKEEEVKAAEKAERK